MKISSSLLRPAIIVALTALVVLAAWILPVELTEKAVPEEPAPAYTALDVSVPGLPRDLPFLHVTPALKIPDLAHVAPEPVQEVTPPEPVPVPAPGASSPRIIIIIDDLGQDRRRTREVIGLPGPLTLAYLPYPKGVAAPVEEGRAAGHEIIMHMPMEAMDGDQDKGAYVLRTGMAEADFFRVLEENLASFGGYVGINNHMGSRLTQDVAAMDRVMTALKARGLFFIDSRTAAGSVTADAAAKAGVPWAARDVFLDHDPSPASVRAALAETERVARRRGVAIAIGHPKDATIAALRAWLPTLGGKGFVLVPVSAAVSSQR